VTFVTGLVLLLGVGTFAHKGDELFAPSVKPTEIAKAEVDYIPATDITPGPQLPVIKQESDNLNIAQILPDEAADISDFEFVRSVQSASVLVTPQVYGTFIIDPVQIDCSLSLSAKSLRGARIQLGLIAPCHKNKIATIIHAGLRFNEIVDNRGRINIIIPVLSDPANIEVSFADGTSKSITTPVKDLSSIQRTLIAWSGRKAIQLRVDETAYDGSQDKQISAQNARSYKESYINGGGYLTSLGNINIEDGSFIQVYSIDNPNGVFVDFSIVLNNPYNNCGGWFSLETVQYTADMGSQSASNNISIRNCSTKNESIVLKNMLRNLIVAQRN
jgi:hypothetical protein